MSHTYRHREERFRSPREHRRNNQIGQKAARGCHGKVGYPSKREANGVVRDMTNDGRNRDGYILQGYKCKLCGRWHVGNSRRVHPLPKAV